MLRAYQYGDQPSLLHDKGFIETFCHVWSINRTEYDSMMRELVVRIK
jgi:hypothetical protein